MAYSELGHLSNCNISKLHKGACYGFALFLKKQNPANHHGQQGSSEHIYKT